METLGVLWDTATTRLANAIIMDVLSMQHEWPDLKLYVPQIAESEELSMALRALGVPTVTDAHTEVWKLYYEKECPVAPESAQHVYKRKLDDGVKDLSMLPGVTNYPAFKDRTRPAPPYANPFNKPRPQHPKMNVDLFLPPWAYQWASTITNTEKAMADSILESNSSSELGFEKWLPFAAQAYNLSTNVKDYLIHPAMVMMSDVPNRNGVAFPLKELIKWNSDHGMQAYRTWIGKPMFEEHRSDVLKTAIGIVIDVSLSPLVGYANGKVYKVMALIAIDRTKNSDLARRIEAGEQNTYSMGAYVGGYHCSYCDEEVGKCGHIDPRDPVTFYEQNGRLVYKNVFDVAGYEFSSVEDPAYIFCTDTRDGLVLDHT